MDNITHSLAGVLLHKAASRDTDRARFSKALFWAVIIASNFPDLDSLYAGISGHIKLGYLLHHRGHTHTIPFTVPIALISAAIGMAFARLRPSTLARREFFAFAGLTWLATLLHLAMDAWNTYGVHPFWPLDSRWFFGDTIFIIEPWIWFCWLPFAWVGAGKAGRWVWSLLGAAMLALCWGAGYMPWQFSLAVTLWLVIQGWVQHRMKEKTGARLAFALGSWFLVFSAFFVSSQLAGTRVREAHATLFPREYLVELMVAPGPVNPSCLFVLALSTGGEGTQKEMRIRRGVYSFFPGSEVISSCGSRFEMGSGMPLLDSPIRDDGGRLLLDAYWSAPLAEFYALVSNNCRFSAFLKFARFPFWRGERAADARYDRGGGTTDFTSIELDEGECPRAIPGWVPPLEELLEGSAGTAPR